MLFPDPFCPVGPLYLLPTGFLNYGLDKVGFVDIRPRFLNPQFWWSFQRELDCYRKPSTLKVYAYAWAGFVEFCRGLNIPWFPVSEIALALCFASLGDVDRVARVRTIRFASSFVTAINTPSNWSSIIQNGMQRRLAHPLRQAAPLTPAILQKALRYLCPDLRNPYSLLTAAFMAFSFIGCARYSDLMACSKTDVTSLDFGFSLFCPFSKTDPLRQGRSIHLGGCSSVLQPGSNIVDIPSPSFLLSMLLQLCPDNTALFPYPGGTGVIPLNWLNSSIRSVITVVTDEATAARFSSHSGRRGGATSAIAAGADLDLVRRLGGWKCHSSAARYMDRDPQLKKLAKVLSLGVQEGLQPVF
eukprot:TRINITY_DN149_c0_g1_i1.p1 TRINITY_DN149_c0_g1~~TRINITY_DN149_c0_g1_i1.p1  ORF type:complete len:357 (-),score=46.80 TRINITY_DN149_c0_g1_i1:1633-2703(-)